MPQPVYLGIEGGGTRTTVIGADAQLRVIAQAEFGPGNVRLLTSQGLAELLESIAARMPTPSAIGFGMAGLRSEADRSRLQIAADKIWPNTPFAITNDLEIALAASPFVEDVARVLVLSGTGSCCFGKSARGAIAKVGGWGHLLGDAGSGYDLSLRALRSAIYEYDRHGQWGQLGAEILRALLLNSPEELIAWAQNAEKRTIAQIAPSVFKAAAEGDRGAKRVLDETARLLAEDALNCAGRVATRTEEVAFVMAGSVLRRQPQFTREVFKRIKRGRSQAILHILEAEGALGAVKLARELPGAPKRAHFPQAPYVPVFDPGLSPTEMRNPKSMRLDRLSLGKAVELMLSSESEVVPALRKEKRAIERAVRYAAEALRAGGRIFYVGAGTSGRLGVLDASECPPTFRASPEMVQGIIAGGPSALWQAVEGAEDDWHAGYASIGARKAGRHDVVIGIAASGRTPFVWGALAQAHRLRAKTVLVCFNPALVIESEHRPDVVIAPNLGPEILTGSTRLKSGTATKLILNMISTLAMVRLGKVMSNLMVDLNPSNVKLRDRAVRIVVEIAGCSAEEARQALERTKWVVKEAIRVLQKGSKSKRPK